MRNLILLVQFLVFMLLAWAIGLFQEFGYRVANGIQAFELARYSYRKWGTIHFPVVAGGSGDEDTVTMVKLTEETQDAFNAKLIKMMEEKGIITVPSAQDPTQTKGDPETAAHEQGVLSAVKLGKLADQLNGLVLNLPIGTVLVGGLPALVLTELTDGFVPPRNDDGTINPASVLVKGLEVFAMNSKMARQILGDKPATFAAAAITLQAAANVLPLDIWVQRAVDFIMRRNKNGVTEEQLRQRQYQRSAVEQAEQVIYGQGAYDAAL